jgi:low affinity Fe/Cu permease
MLGNQSLSNRITKAGHHLSSRVADAAAQPLTQAGLIIFCLLWWASGLPTDILTATLSILAITLTQMVLNQQKLREVEDRRRDVAMHAKLDELLRAETNASKELAGIEELESAEIAALKRRLRRDAAKRPPPRTGSIVDGTAAARSR